MEEQLLLQSLALPMPPRSSCPSSPRRRASLKTAFHGRYAHARRVPRALVAKCSVSEDEPSGDLKDALSGIVGARVEELLSREENWGLLDGVERASRTVDEPRRELAEIERQEVEAREMRNYIEQLEGRASEIAESQRELSEARALVEEAEHSLAQTTKARDEDVDGTQIDYLWSRIWKVSYRMPFPARCT